MLITYVVIVDHVQNKKPVNQYCVNCIVNYVRTYLIAVHVIGYYVVNLATYVSILTCEISLNQTCKLNMI